MTYEDLFFHGVSVFFVLFALYGILMYIKLLKLQVEQLEKLCLIPYYTICKKQYILSIN